MPRFTVRRYSLQRAADDTFDLLLEHDGGSDQLAGLRADEAEFLADLLRYEQPVDYNPAARRFGSGYEPIGEAELPSLETWLAEHQAVANAICWERPITPGYFQRIYPYTQWSQDEKRQLRDTYAAILSRTGPMLQDPPPNAFQASGDEQMKETLITFDRAWPLYLAHVAHTLAVEIGRWLPWSITNYSDAQLRMLLDSREFFTWYNGDRYRIDMVKHGCVVPAPAWSAFTFLAKTVGLGATPRQMVANLLEWCRRNLVHMISGFTAENFLAHWQYAGWPPVSRIISGTINSQFLPDKKHYTAGCWGTSGFLRAVLRTVNIPVVPAMLENASHAIPGFPTLSLYLSHSDDVYNTWNLTHPRWPSDDIFIDLATFISWFGPQVSSEVRNKNIGRRPYLLALLHLPYYLLEYHCWDLRKQNGPADSAVYEKFKSKYALAELLAMNLWDRLDQKIAVLGGCLNVPYDDVGQGQG